MAIYYVPNHQPSIHQHLIGDFGHVEERLTSQVPHAGVPADLVRAGLGQEGPRAQGIAQQQLHDVLQEVTHLTREWIWRTMEKRNRRISRNAIGYRRRCWCSRYQCNANPEALSDSRVLCGHLEPNIVGQVLSFHPGFQDKRTCYHWKITYWFVYSVLTPNDIMYTLQSLDTTS